MSNESYLRFGPGFVFLKQKKKFSDTRGGGGFPNPPPPTPPKSAPAMLKIQRIFNELITTCPLSNHIQIITNFVKLGCCTALRRRWPPMNMTHQFCRVPVFGCHCGNESSFFPVMFHINENYFKMSFYWYQYWFYVPFGKSVDDVTFRFSLRHHFLPRLKKLWSITISIITGYIENTIKAIDHRNHIFLENLESSY